MAETVLLKPFASRCWNAKLLLAFSNFGVALPSGGDILPEEPARSQDFDRDVMSTAPGESFVQEDIRQIITLIARASHDIADLVSLGQLAKTQAVNGEGEAVSSVSIARRVLLDHLKQSRVKTLSCCDDPEVVELSADGIYHVTIDPLEGLGDHEANLPFGTIFSVCGASSSEERGRFYAAGFIHYGPQTNLVFSVGAGVHIFNLDRAARTYRLAAQNVRIPDERREWSVDVTKRQRWPSSVRAWIDEELEQADKDGPRANVRWTGSLTSDAFRILRDGGIYLAPIDDRAGREDSCPNLVHAARPVAFIIEQAGGRATTGSLRILDRAGSTAAERTSMIFGSPGIVNRVERLHALPENQFDTSPLFHRRGLFWT